VPPNSEVRLIFTCAVNNGVNKSTRVDAAAGMLTTAVSSLWLNTYTITRPDKVPESYELTLITPDSFKASIATAALDIQHMTKANLVRLSAFFISTAATTAVTAGVNKLYTVPYFRYVTDGFAGATALLNLYFKAGNQQLPQRQFDNTFQFTDAWNQFAEMTDKGFDPAGSETEANWLIKGPIYTVPVIRSIKDTSRNIELHGNFTAAPAALAYLVAHYEQHLTFTYDSYGSPTGALIKSV